MNKEIALYVADQLHDQICRYGMGAKMSAIDYDEKTDTLHFCIEFRGWYGREKAIDVLYNHFEVGGYDVSTDTQEMSMTISRKPFQDVHICDIAIEWVNLEQDEEVPEIMQGLLSGVSYEQYKTF
jgi:hypothetical protein